MEQAVHDLMSLACYLESKALTPGLIASGAEFYSDTLRDACGDRERVVRLFDKAARAKLIKANGSVVEVDPVALARHQDGLSSEARLAWANAAFRLIHYLFNRSSGDAQVVGRLLPHLMRLSAEAGPAGLPPYPLSTLMYRAGLELHESGDYEPALPLLVRAVKATLASGDEKHPVVATRINTLGLCYQQTGDLKNARRCFEQALGICETVFGPTEEAVYRVDDERLLTLPMRNLCRVLLETDDLESVQRAYDRALNVYLRVHGPEHPLVAECANDMGQVWFEMGHLDRAANHFERAIVIEENAATSTTGYLAAYLVNLATVRLHQGSTADAEKLYRRALALDRRDYGERSQEFARDLAGLGETLRKERRYPEAMEALETAGRIYEGLSEEDHSSWLRSIESSMGKICHDAHDYAAAVEHFRRAIGLVRKSEPRNRFALGREYANLARSLFLSEQHELARVTAERGLQVLTVSTDPLAAELRGKLLAQLGELYEGLGDFQSAREHYDNAFDSDRSNLGETHPSVGRDLARIGALLAKTGDPVGAVAHLNRAITVLEQQSTPDRRRIAWIREKIERIANT